MKDVKPEASTALTAENESPMERFRKQMKAKIASDLGNAIPTDVIGELAETVVKDLINEGMRNSNYQQPKGWIRQEIETEVRQQVKDAIAPLLKDKEMWQDVIKQVLIDTLPAMLAGVFVDHTRNEVMDQTLSLQFRIEQALNRPL